MMDIFNWVSRTIMTELDSIKDIEIQPNNSFAEIGVDSIGVMTLFVLIEEHFNIEIDEAIMIDDSISSIGDLCSYINEKVSS
ncbi:acyl carrier protein [Paenibacillus humicus]|uniref:acyl carrier protein n=1 Tax=Paenibacillus humicus TaxID=412861 RepID=UPI003D29878A